MGIYQKRQFNPQAWNLSRKRKQLTSQQKLRKIAKGRQNRKYLSMRLKIHRHSNSGLNTKTTIGIKAITEILHRGDLPVGAYVSHIQANE